MKIKASLCILILACTVLVSCKTNTTSKCGPCLDIPGMLTRGFRGKVTRQLAGER